MKSSFGKFDVTEKVKNAKPKDVGGLPEFASRIKRPGGMACGGKVRKMAKGGGVESHGKTRGRFC